MMKINLKKVEKILRKVAFSEYDEKKPKTLKLLRMKPNVVFSEGSSVKILRNENPYFIIVEEREKHFYILYYSREGAPLGGKEWEITPKFRDEIRKGTIKVLELPR